MNALEAIVLAGGLGTRLRSEVSDLPKVMAPVAGRPFLAHVLERLDAGGVRRAIVSVGYMAEAIVSRFGERFGGLRIAYARESEPLGTGGAIALALSCATEDRVLVVNGDTYLDMDYRRFVDHCTLEDAGLGIVVRQVADAARYGRCEIDSGRVVRFAEKAGAGPGLINAGVYCARRDLLEPFALPARFSFEHDFISPFLAAIRPVGHVVDGYFVDIGIPEDYRRAQADLAAPDGEASSPRGAS